MLFPQAPHDWRKTQSKTKTKSIVDIPKRSSLAQVLTGWKGLWGRFTIDVKSVRAYLALGEMWTLLCTCHFTKNLL